MKLIFIAGLFCVFNCFHVKGENQEFALSSKNAEKVKIFMCVLFPRYVKSDCSESEISSDKNFETNAEIDIHIHIKTGTRKPVKTFSPADPDLDCMICAGIVYANEVTINNSFSVSDIQKVLFGMCQILNSDVKKKCITFWSSSVGLQVIKDVLNSEDPDKICQLMNTCIKKFGNFGQKSFLYLFLIKPFNKDNSCDICKYEIAYLEKVINMSQTPEQVQQRFLATCSLVKTSDKEDCTNFYQDSMEIIKAVLKNENPQTVCHKIGPCKSNVESFELNEENLDFLPKANYGFFPRVV